MRKNVLTLLVGFGGLLTTWIGSNQLIDSFAYQTNFPPRYSEALNYHQINMIRGWDISEIIIPYALYVLSIYVIAFIIQQRSRNASNLEPSLLALSGAIGFWLGGKLPVLVDWILGNSPSINRILGVSTCRFNACHWPILPHLNWLLPIAISLLGIRLACIFEPSKSTPNRFILWGRWVIPISTLFLLIVLHKGNFPGVAALPEARQKWGYKEFFDYGKVVEMVKSCDAIREQVGTVKLVAPTQGKNYTIYDSGSSGHKGEMTLEVIGDKNTGILNFTFSFEIDLRRGQFTSQGKNEILYCPPTPYSNDYSNESYQMIGLVEVPAIFGVHDSNRPPGQTPPQTPKPIPLFRAPGVPANKAKIVTTITTPDQLESREHAYGELSAAVYSRLGQWSKVRVIKPSRVGFAWLSPTDSGPFHSLEELLSNSLTFLTKDWDKKLYSQPNDQAPFTTIAVKPDKPELDVRVLQTKTIKISQEGEQPVDMLWLEVELISPGWCESKPLKSEQHGWVPAYSGKGFTFKKETVWFYARGC